MCGIAGIVGKHKLSRETMLKTSALLRHRGPDDEGFYMHSMSNDYNCWGNDTIEELNYLTDINSVVDGTECDVSFMHRRLSIIDLTKSGHQPFSADNGNFVITYNGEVYNYSELYIELKTLGYNFVSASDTEVVLNSYIEWGENCVNKFVGMWSFAIYDKRKNLVFISRDRFGIKPLYYTSPGNNFIFSSDIKPLLLMAGIRPSVNAAALQEILCLGGPIGSGMTPFSGIYSLEPGHNVVVNTNKFEVKTYQYYDLSEKVKNYKMPYGDVYENYYSSLYESVRIHLRSDTEVGSCLSGGLDSGTIAGMTSLINNNIFKTFTSSYKDIRIDESGYVKTLGMKLGNLRSYFTYPDSNGLMKDFRDLIYNQELPVSSTSVFSQWKVMELASVNKIKVLLDGQGADESLGGYSIFAGFYLLDMLKNLHLKEFTKNFKDIKRNRGFNVSNQMSRALYHQIPAFLRRMIRANTRIGNSFIRKDFARELTKNKAENIRNYEQFSVYSILNGLQELLRYEDKNSMAFSIESRVPFLDHRLVELSISLDSSYKYMNGYSKYILRKAAERILPDDITWRKDKLGFVTPQMLWKNESHDKLNEMITNLKCPDVIDRDKLLEYNNKQLTGSNDLSEFWKTFSVLVWYDLFL